MGQQGLYVYNRNLAVTRGDNLFDMLGKSQDGGNVRMSDKGAIAKVDVFHSPVRGNGLDNISFFHSVFVVHKLNATKENKQTPRIFANSASLHSVK